MSDSPTWIQEMLAHLKRTSLKINTTSVSCFNRVWERSVAYILLFIPLPSVIPIEAGVFLSALLLFSGSNQRSKDKVAQLHLISILIPLCLSSLILLIPPYPLHHGRQVVELVKIRNQSTLPSLSVSFCFYAHKSRTGKIVSSIP